MNTTGDRPGTDDGIVIRVETGRLWIISRDVKTVSPFKHVKTGCGDHPSFLFNGKRREDGGKSSTKDENEWS
jgi:hypothetical protein